MSGPGASSRIAEALSQDAELAVHDDLNLWPAIQQRLPATARIQVGRQSGRRAEPERGAAARSGRRQAPSRVNTSIATAMVAILALAAAGVAILLNGGASSSLFPGKD